MKTHEKPDEREEQGIKAIIALQAVAGITETREQAIEGWRSMTELQKTVTLNYAKALRGKHRLSNENHET